MDDLEEEVEMSWHIFWKVKSVKHKPAPIHSEVIFQEPQKTTRLSVGNF